MGWVYDPETKQYVWEEEPYKPPAATGNIYTQPGAYVPPAATGKTYTSAPANPPQKNPFEVSAPAPAQQKPAEPTAEQQKPQQQPAAEATTGITFEPIINNDPNSPLYGKVTGYQEYVDGKPTRVYDYSSLMLKLYSVERPKTYQEYLAAAGLPSPGDITQTAEYKGISDIIAQLQNPQTVTEDQLRAADITAQRLGYQTGAEMQTGIQGMRQQLEGGYAGMPGLSAQERETMERLRRSDIRDIETAARRQIDQILSGASGNSMNRALMQSNEYIKQIRDVELQADYQLMTMDFERKTRAFDEKFAMYKDLLDRGQISETQLMDAFTQNRLSALQGYATQVGTLLQQNQQYLSMYQADLDRVRMAADQVYQEVQSELGVDAALRDQISDSFKQYWDEIMAPLLKQETEANIRAANQTRTQGILQGILSVAAFAVGAILTVTGAGAGAGVALMAAGAGGVIGAGS